MSRDVLGIVDSKPSRSVVLDRPEDLAVKLDVLEPRAAALGHDDALFRSAV